MEVEFLEKFNKDVDAVKEVKVKQALEQIILQIESAKLLSEIVHLKKLKGHKTAYRIRMGDYRIGLFVEKNIVQFARLAHRKDIYKYFP